jgi:hypothetical protein
MSLFSHSLTKTKKTGNKNIPQAVPTNDHSCQEKGLDVLNSQEHMRFEMVVLSNLDATIKYARWHWCGGADVEQVAQEAMVRPLLELEGCSDKEIVAITWFPIGTVMPTPLWDRRQLDLVLADPNTGKMPNELKPGRHYPPWLPR